MSTPIALEQAIRFLSLAEVLAIAVQRDAEALGLAYVPPTEPSSARTLRPEERDAPTVPCRAA